MNAEQLALYEQLQQWQPDDSSSAFSFSKRLARYNGWRHSFALRVIEEYKKFIFLAICAGHPVSPSEQVDQTCADSSDGGGDSGCSSGCGGD